MINSTSIIAYEHRDTYEHIVCSIKGFKSKYLVGTFLDNK